MRSCSDLYEIMEIRASGNYQALATWVDRSLTINFSLYVICDFLGDLTYEVFVNMCSHDSVL